MLLLQPDLKVGAHQETETKARICLQIFKGYIMFTQGDFQHTLSIIIQKMLMHYKKFCSLTMNTDLADIYFLSSIKSSVNFIVTN